ncbi:cytochrome P450 [Byssothecium circinans]|uniref:Cytochrome P450 n=1 Tax=Byssothecium circinans TaxID=147558 RepID=A0A6A5TWN5_9PLEO|nr:cytochrome P450 [Byssothecium circinans]
MSFLDVFGPNIATTNGKDWQRQRKVTAASFNEQNNVLVWTESLRQGKQMLEYWVSAGRTGTTSLAHDVRTLTLNVLAHAAFGKSFNFKAHDDKASIVGALGPLSYRDALASILENAILTVALGPAMIHRLAFVPRLKHLSEAIHAFKRYMTEMFEENSQHTNARGNLITSLVRASSDSKVITPEEVIGNIFVLNFAGHDTTAHSFAFTFMLLAANPEVQEWMAEEINHVAGKTKNDELSYELFPRFVRTLAVLLETIRLYDPLLSIVKGTESRPAQLSIGEQDLIVPPYTRVIFNINAIHSLPRYWGEDALEWKPSRWIRTRSGKGPVFDREEILMPENGAYIPWGEGMRSCPGKKFSQVEHVAVMAAIFRDHYVVPVAHKGEDILTARSRAKDTVKDTGMMLLLQMFHPEKTPLEWGKRA